ncbi:hypothetical protein PLICRDRAFT_34493 [Plicaturopsis crispa FD-325 SS-3]|nr:hypothetical protein PLICRDRAFT_34493 [Plicaturopsis crispa FD-325 SS-3]
MLAMKLACLLASLATAITAVSLKDRGLRSDGAHIDNTASPHPARGCHPSTKIVSEYIEPAPTTVTARPVIPIFELECDFF